jgi:excisionase family DNA binding protein
VVTVTRCYLTVPEAAEYLGMTEAALRQKIQRQEITFHRDGRRLSFKIDDLEAHMRACRVEATR